MNLRKIIQDYLFPSFCVSCGFEGENICNACLGQLSLEPSCTKEDELDHMCSMWVYDEKSVVGKLLKMYKYDYCEEILGRLAGALRAFCTAHTHSDLIAGIVPVPLHARRLAERGFNQAEQIAKIIASEVGVPLMPLLKRSVYTDQQAKKSKGERLSNVTGVFSVSGEITVGSTYLLVDDIYTSGATMQQCARVLKDAGAGPVHGLTLARG